MCMCVRVFISTVQGRLGGKGPLMQRTTGCEKVGYEALSRKNVPGRGSSQHKGPETLHPWCVRPNDEAGVAETLEAERRAWVKKVPER